MKLRSLFFPLLLVFGVARADEYEPRTYTAPDGQTLGYRLLKPKNFDPANKYPLVLFLHGAGERGSDNQLQLKHGAPLFLKPEVRNRFRCFVVAPQCPPERKWTDIDWASDTPKQPNEASSPMKLVLAVL